MLRWGMLAVGLVACSEVAVVNGGGAAPEEAIATARLWLPARGNAETGATVEAFCPVGMHVEDAECVASSPRVAVLAVDVETQDGGVSCAVRNDDEQIETATLTVWCAP